MYFCENHYTMPTITSLYLDPYADKRGLRRIVLQIFCNKIRVRQSTDYKVEESQFDPGAYDMVIKHRNAKTISQNIRAKLSKIEKEITEAETLGVITKEILDTIVKGKKVTALTFDNFIVSYLDENKNTMSPGTIKAYNTVLNSLKLMMPKIELANVNFKYLKTFETKMFEKGLDVNTINKRMKTILSFVHAAEIKSLINRDNFKQYKVPHIVEKIPSYINEAEMISFKKVCDATLQPMIKVSGYYFLLSCYAGYRISDLKNFDYQKMVDKNKIVLKAKKNGKIISMPIHSRLREVLDFCKDHPLNISEQNMRAYVKDIAKLAGINKLVKVHTARHSFAMMLTDNDFDLEDVAELLGNTIRAAQVYSRISNKRIERKITEKLG